MVRRAVAEAFSQILAEQIKRLKFEEVYRNELEIARRANIDPATFSLLKTGKRARVSKVLKYRLQLAAVMGKDFDEIHSLAQRFVNATPTIEIESGDLLQEIKTIAVRYLQNELQDVEIGVPLFFDTAPFYVAEKHGYFESAGLRVKLDYVKWAKALEYLNSSHERASSVASDSHKTKTQNSELRLVIYNRESILTDGRDESIVFCFPLAIYFPNNFVLWLRGEVDDDWRKCLKRLVDARGDALRIIVSGRDMLEGVVTAFDQANIEPNRDWFVILDQFDGPEAFFRELGDLWVGGVPQNAATPKGRTSSTVTKLITGDKIGLLHQFNGIACKKQDLESDASRRVILQVAWAWYKALHTIDTYLDIEAEFITNKMNVYAGKMKYNPDHFKTFWREKRNKFLLPESPQEMIRCIYANKDYKYRLYDWTNNFAESLQMIEKVISTNGTLD